MQIIFPLFAGVLCFGSLTAAAEKRISVTVIAGAFDRRQTVVTFQLPPGAQDFLQARDGKGKLVPVQIEKGGRASFVVDQLAKGAQATYELVSAPAEPASTVSVKRAGTKLKISLPHHPLLEYQAEPGELPRDNIKAAFKRGGYLHPIQTLSGRTVTDDFPANHIHHHGVWWAWTHTTFDGRSPDFWNMGDGKGRVEFVGLGETWSGPIHGGFTARHRFVDLTAPKPATALNETWEVRAYNQPGAEPFWVFDLTSSQDCATSHPLKLPLYRYGGVGLRGNWAWNGKDKTSFLTSDGETDRLKGNTARGRWCDMGGLLDGQHAGIAILGHPENFRAPEPMRLHPTEPFFCFAPQQSGDMEIAPGKTYVARYRFIVHDGPPDKTVLDRLWNDYAFPPQVKVVEQ